MGRSYDLLICGHFLSLITDGAGTPYRIVNPLPRQNCPECDSPGCYRHCDASTGHEAVELDHEVIARAGYNSAISAMEQLAAAHATLGINVGSGVYLNGLHQVMEQIQGAFDAASVLPSSDAEAHRVQG